MSATALKQRLREDLKAAMQARASDEVGVLRNLIAALDNAEAVPVDPGQRRANPHAFGVAAGEHPRLDLGSADVAELIAAEIEARLAAAAGYEAHGQAAEAARLRAEAAKIERYRAP